MSENHPLSQPPEGTPIFVLKQNGEQTDLIEATAFNRQGPHLGVKQGTARSYRLTNEHRSNIFTPEQVAVLADDLLPMPEIGEERVLSDVIHELVSDPALRPKLLSRLAEVAMSERLGGEKDMADFGVRELDELVGSPDRRGTNMWKVEDLISMGHEVKKASNTLVLAHPEEDELSLLPNGEASKIREQIFDTNKLALNKIYDYYDVSYPEARSYEMSLPDGRIQRTTVYPSLTEGIYFIESGIGDSIGKPTSVEISTFAPDFPPESGYMRVM